MARIKGSNFTWSNEEVGQLTELWKAGYSAGQIAKLMDKSRSAVLGKIFRLQITR